MKISVVIPAYNAEAYIERAIVSIVNQSNPVHEIIVVDDGSTDQTEREINTLKEKYGFIKFFSQKNAGVSATRNHGISKAEGDWVLLLDADDECAPTLIQQYIMRISDGTYSALYSDFVQIDEFGHKISDTFSGLQLLGREGFCQLLLRNPIISPSGSIILKSMFTKLKGFDTTIKYDEDVDFWLRLLLNGNNIGHVSEPLSFIRRHSNNTTANMESTRYGEKRLLDKFGLSIIKDTIYERNYAIEHNHLDYVQFLIRFELWHEAEQLLETIQIDSADERYCSFLFVKALVALQLEKYMVAQELYIKILKWNNAHGATLNNIGVLYAMNNELEKARDALQRALQHYPDYMDATYNLKQLDDENPIFRFTKRELRKNLLRYS